MKTPTTFLASADKLHHWAYIEHCPYTNIASLNITTEQMFIDLHHYLCSDDFLYKGCQHGNMFTLTAQEHQIMYLILMSVIYGENNGEENNVNN